jgi:hypothetical protein
MKSFQKLKISDSDIGRWHAISILLNQDPWLLDFVFTVDRSRLTADPQSLIEDSRCFSGAQQLLVQIALHIWTSDGKLNLWDIAHSLDELRFDSFSMCLQALRS